MNKEKIQQRIGNLEIELEGLKRELEGKKLRLEVNYDNLEILYWEERVGVISKLGSCRILSYRSAVEAYEQWREDGMFIDNTIVEWMGGEYRLTEDFYLRRSDIYGGNIYCFDVCTYFPGCEDDNIKRFKHNLRPIGY